MNQSASLSPSSSTVGSRSDDSKASDIAGTKVIGNLSLYKTKERYIDVYIERDRVWRGEIIGIYSFLGEERKGSD